MRPVHTPEMDSIKIDEVTISFICSRYPRKMIRHLEEKREYKVECVEQGIYRVTGDCIPIQIIVSSQLSREENLWLKSLTNEIKEPDMVEELLESYRGHAKNPLYKLVMDIVV